MKAKTGLTTVTFRQKNIDEIIKIAVRAELDGIEVGGDVHLPPGDIVTARSIREKASESGLEIFSYGSYFKAGESDVSDFGGVLKSAVALGAPVIRVWTTPDGDKTVGALREVCVMAKDAGLTIGLEFHNGTYNDGGERSLEILERVNADNLFTYWQPLYGNERNLADIAKINDVCKYVHVYNWIYGESDTVRLKLDDPPWFWQSYVKSLGDKTYIMEFVRGDDENELYSDAQFLRSILK